MPLNETRSQKAIIIYMQGNEVERKDCAAFAEGLGRAGFKAEVYRLSHIAKNDLYRDKDWGSYSFVGFTPNFNALWQSGYNHKACMKHIFENSRDEALSLITCDTTINIDVSMWDKGETSKEGKEQVFCYKPLKILGSFDKKILEDQEAMKTIQSKYLRKLHPDSEFIPLEWNVFHVYNLEEDLNKKIALSKEIEEEVYPDGLPEVEGFYYGIKKKKVADELKEMGFGKNPGDTVFGAIADLFPGEDYPDLQKFGGNSRRRQPEYWIPLAKAAKKVYVPYDPVKGDFQFTKRFLEVALLKENPSEIEASPKIAEEIREYLAVDKWESKAKEVEQELKELYG